MKRVGFVLNNNKDSWRGGYEYLKNLFNCLKSCPNNQIEPIIITSVHAKNNEFRDLGNYKVIKTRLVNKNAFWRILHKILILFFGKNFFFESFLLKNQIKLISHFYLAGRNSVVKSIYWIPDFQEIKNLKYLNFKMKLLRKINTHFSMKNSNIILLSSKSAQNDLKKINIEACKKSCILKPFFNVYSLKSLYKFSEIRKKYKLNKKFFFLPNQFWVHKNHILVLKALKELKKENKNLYVVSTGLLHDYRYPKHREYILNYIKINNLNDNFKILGIVPYKDLMSLMAYSIAVINPSKSEGWSSTVEQAKSFGKIVLLSDIDVHKEQNPKRAIYFKTNDIKKLKGNMINLDKKFKLKNELNISNKILSKQHNNKVLFGNKYQKIVNNLLNKI